MLNLYPYLCDDPGMDLSPIRAKSERLYRDILRERKFYAEHPECDNVHFFHSAKQCYEASYWVDRWGIVLSYKKSTWVSLRGRIGKNPAVHGKGYFSVFYRVGGVKVGIEVHRLVADVFLPNTDFTKVQLDHLNSDELDNNALNLERVTPEENVRRREVMLCHKKGKPIPWKYLSLKNYLTHLQTKNRSPT